MSAIHVQGLSVRLGGREVLKGLDLDVPAGEFLVLLGPSGCGKSTLLQGIAGLVDVQAGRVHIGGRDVTRADPAERGIGMVFQSYALYPSMTARGNLGFGLKVAGTPKAEIERRVAQVAKMLQLEALLDRRPAQLSGGQRQRVAIGRALVREVGVYLLDEPLSNLDAQLRMELRRDLKLLHQRLGATMVHVTHDQVEAMSLATRVAVMKDGVIQQIDTPQALYDNPANRFVAGFVGAPAMNFVEGALAGQLRSDLNRPVVLGVRPEHVKPAAQGRFAATVQVVESLGAQQLLWLEHGDFSLSALADAGHGFAPGQMLAFDIDPARVLAFCAGTGARL